MLLQGPKYKQPHRSVVPLFGLGYCPLAHCMNIGMLRCIPEKPRRLDEGTPDPNRISHEALEGCEPKDLEDLGSSG